MSEENLFYIGRFGETVVEDDNGVMVKDAEMFSVGTHRGVEYKEDDLKALLENFSDADEVPIQIDHSNSALHTVGYLKEVSMKEGKLLGKLHVIDEVAQNRIKQGLMKKLSISFYLKKTKNGLKPSKIREVSLVAFPQVKSARLFSENGYVSDYEEETPMADENKNLEALKAELRAELDGEMKAEFSSLMDRLAKLEGADEKLKETQIEAQVKQFSEESKIVPAQSDALTKLLGTFSEAQQTLFNEFMSNAQQIDFDEQGQFEQHDGEEEEKKEELSEDDKFYQEHVKKYGQSL